MDDWDREEGSGDESDGAYLDLAIYPAWVDSIVHRET